MIRQGNDSDDLCHTTRKKAKIMVLQPQIPEQHLSTSFHAEQITGGLIADPILRKAQAEIQQRLRSDGLASNGRIRKSDGSYIVVSGDRTAINELVNKLRSSSIDEQRSSADDIRSLAKRSIDNMILIAEAGAIPVLVNLLLSDDEKTQEHAVTTILNLSIYESNKMLIVLAGAIAPIVQVLRSGSMEARENAAASLFSLSIDDANKITIGSTPGAIDELVELLRTGSLRGRKDAATTLFNLCIYQGNKARAVWAGIMAPLHNFYMVY